MQPDPATIRITKPAGTLLIREPMPRQRASQRIPKETVTFNLVPGFECVLTSPSLSAATRQRDPHPDRSRHRKIALCRPLREFRIRDAPSYGSNLNQELKRVCYEAGKLPAARCDPSNIASRKTLEKAGMHLCGQLQVGEVKNST